MSARYYALHSETGEPVRVLDHYVSEDGALLCPAGPTKETANKVGTVLLPRRTVPSRTVYARPEDLTRIPPPEQWRVQATFGMSSARVHAGDTTVKTFTAATSGIARGFAREWLNAVLHAEVERAEAGPETLQQDFDEIHREAANGLWKVEKITGFGDRVMVTLHATTPTVTLTLTDGPSDYEGPSRFTAKVTSDGRLWDLRPADETDERSSR